MSKPNPMQTVYALLFGFGVAFVMLVVVVLLTFNYMVEADTGWYFRALYPSPDGRLCAMVVKRQRALSRDWYEIHLYKRFGDKCSSEWDSGGDGSEVASSFFPFPKVAWEGPAKLVYVGESDPWCEK